MKPELDERINKEDWEKLQESMPWDLEEIMI